MRSGIFLQTGLDDPNQLDRAGEFRLSEQTNLARDRSRPVGFAAFSGWASRHHGSSGRMVRGGAEPVLGRAFARPVGASSRASISASAIEADTTLWRA